MGDADKLFLETLKENISNCKYEIVPLMFASEDTEFILWEILRRDETPKLAENLGMFTARKVRGKIVHESTKMKEGKEVANFLKIQFTEYDSQHGKRLSVQKAV